MAGNQKSLALIPEEYDNEQELYPVIQSCLYNFSQSEDKELAFPSSLSNKQRKFVHNFAANYNLKTRSKGKNVARFVTVYKNSFTSRNNIRCKLELDQNSYDLISSLLQKYPVGGNEIHDLLPPTERGTNAEVPESSNSIGQLFMGKSQIPLWPSKTEISEEAKKLPIYGHKGEIMSELHENQVVLISGETGSGKTTQVPQMVLEESTSLNRPCKILCTQPRRISAISVAERVSAERGEQLGGTIGYQIKLERRTSSKTVLTFCTTGVVLRALMGRSKVLAGFTHIFVDEVHERDKFMDFLLIVLRDLLASHTNLKVILMSANLDVELYSKYFNCCPIVRVPVMTYPVKQYFLEDVLEITNYRTSKMLMLVESLKKKESKKQSVISQNGSNRSDELGIENGKPQLEERCYSPNTTNQLDDYLSNAFLTGEEENFANIIYFIMSEDVSPDYQHSTNNITPLMVSAGRGRTDIMGMLLNLNASITLKSSNGWTASDWAASTNQSEALEMLEAHRKVNGITAELDKLSCNDELKVSTEKTLFADAYHSSCSDNDCDKELIFAIVSKIHSCEARGGILVFLPGYDDIVYIKEKILGNEKIFNHGKNIALFCLHSSMQSSDQKKAFNSVSHGTRKIVLATNIAETSVTINDIIYVVDSGMHKEMSYDAVTSCSSLRTVRISQASLNQRKGRAGRCQPGVAYHLISEETYKKLKLHQTAEILRTPIQDLCLQSKLLSLPNVPIADFISKAPEAPTSVSVNEAVHLLKKMDALDQWEDLTQLGHHLLDLSLSPHLGKMVLIACILKCLDPVLTIAAFLSYKDPFILSMNMEERSKAKMARKKFGHNMFSDHYLLLSVYEGYEKAIRNNYEEKWCSDHFISVSTMKLVSRSRLQILAQLRLSGFLQLADIRDVNKNSDNWSLVKAAILCGVYPRIMKLDRYKNKFQIECYNQLRLYRNCALLEAFEDVDVSAYSKTVKKISKSLQTDWFFYDELTGTPYQAIVHKVTPVSALSVLLFAGPMRLKYDTLSQSTEKKNGTFDDKGSNSDDEIEESTGLSIALDSWVQFSTDQTTQRLLLQLRYKIQSYIQRRLKAPFKPITPVDDEIIQVVADLLKKEDDKLGLLKTNLTSQSSNNKVPLLRTVGATITRNGTRYGSNRNNLNVVNGSGRQRDGDYKAKQKCEGNSAVTTTNTITLSARKPVACSESAIKSDAPQHNRDFHRKEASGGNKIDVKYFIVRFPTFRQIEIAQNLGMVTFALDTERKLLNIIQKQRVILIFALNRGKQFFGYSKFDGRKSERRQHPEFSNLDHLNQVFKVNFIRSNVLFHQTRHLLNSLNENLQIHMCRDGQEVGRDVGEQLVKILDRELVASASGSQVFMNDLTIHPRRPFMPHHYSQRPPHFMPSHPGYRPDFGGPYIRPFRGYGFGGGFRGVHRGFRRGMGH